jgi:hypothetical protein
MRLGRIERQALSFVSNRRGIVLVADILEHLHGNNVTKANRVALSRALKRMQEKGLIWKPEDGVVRWVNRELTLEVEEAAKRPLPAILTGTQGLPFHQATQQHTPAATDIAKGLRP